MGLRGNSMEALTALANVISTLYGVSARVRSRQQNHFLPRVFAWKKTAFQLNAAKCASSLWEGIKCDIKC